MLLGDKSLAVDPDSDQGFPFSSTPVFPSRKLFHAHPTSTPQAVKPVHLLVPIILSQAHLC